MTGYKVETDCKQLVDKVIRDWEELSEIGHIVQAIRKDVKHPLCTRISHTKRMFNGPVHNLAKYACNLIEPRIWMEDGPTCIYLAILADLNE